MANAWTRPICISQPDQCISDQAQCKSTNHEWTQAYCSTGSCSRPEIPTKSVCIAPRNTWTAGAWSLGGWGKTRAWKAGFCSSEGTCSDTTHTTEAACSALGVCSDTTHTTEADCNAAAVAAAATPLDPTWDSTNTWTAITNQAECLAPIYTWRASTSSSITTENACNAPAHNWIVGTWSGAHDPAVCGTCSIANLTTQAVCGTCSDAQHMTQALCEGSAATWTQATWAPANPLDLNPVQAAQFAGRRRTHGGLYGPSTTPWQSATHILYKDELPPPGTWKIVELAKKDQVLGTGPKDWIAKTSCDAGNKPCGLGTWTEKGACSDATYTNQAACIAPSAGTCSNPALATQSDCVPPATWTLATWTLTPSQGQTDLGYLGSA